MNFATPTFLLTFLPGTLLLVAAARRIAGPRAALGALVAASLVFYALWDVGALWVILVSVGSNYALSRLLARRHETTLLAAAVAANLGYLAWFKYADLLTSTGSVAAALPLGLSFFTFQQIAYLVDLRARREVPSGPLDYAAFVTFFPQLVAGPIVRHGDLVPQLRRLALPGWDDPRLVTAEGFLLLGLFKKTMIADPIGRAIDPAWADAAAMTAYDAWVALTGYALQLYFDFSAYCEIAIGAALLFGVRLPANFDSPYKSRSVREFWRRWHMTLGAFLRDYLYVPLGGSRGGRMRMLAAIWATMLLAGIWHGAGATFVVWGALHAAYISVERIWPRGWPRPNASAAAALTLAAVVIAWLPFRAESLSDALTVARALIGLGEAHGLPLALAAALGGPASASPWFTGIEPAWLLILWAVVLSAPNVTEIVDRGTGIAGLRGVAAYPLAYGLAACVAVGIGQDATFLYWRW